MNLKEPFINELAYEVANTRKMLERIPDDKLQWQPHEKSMTLAQLTSHVAELPGWITYTIDRDELNFATFDYKPFIPTNHLEILEVLDKSAAGAMESLKNATNEHLMQTWTLRKGDTVIMSLPRVAVIRSMALNHWYHHRGQLSVYLRLLNIPVPGMYGPSADEQQM